MVAEKPPFVRDDQLFRCVPDTPTGHPAAYCENDEIHSGHTYHENGTMYYCFGWIDDFPNTPIGLRS